MDLKIVFLHIFITIGTTWAEITNATRTNWCLHQELEDIFLPTKIRKLGPTFIYLSKNKPTRWRIYWRHVTAQILLGLYFVLFLALWCIFGSLEFVTKTCFIVYPLLPTLSGIIFDAGVFFYVKHMQRKLKRNQRIYKREDVIHRFEKSGKIIYDAVLKENYRLSRRERRKLLHFVKCIKVDREFTRLCLESLLENDNIVVQMEAARFCLSLKVYQVRSLKVLEKISENYQDSKFDTHAKSIVDTYKKHNRLRMNKCKRKL